MDTVSYDVCNVLFSRDVTSNNEQNTLQITR